MTHVARYKDVVVFDDLDEDQSPAIEDGGVFVAHDEVVGKGHPD